MSDEEKMVNLSDIDMSLTSNQIALEDDIFVMRDKQIDDLMGEVEAILVGKDIE